MVVGFRGGLGLTWKHREKEHDGSGGCVRQACESWIVAAGRRDDGMAVLSEPERLRSLSAYLASSHAATLESLPSSASKSMRRRLVEICSLASRGLTGDMGWLLMPATPLDAARRCDKAARMVAE
jgi:hypothetical protein